jgi:hypothetical protein
MRDTFGWIDSPTNTDDNLRHALYDLAAQVLASQAFAVAYVTHSKIVMNEARRLMEQLAGYPGATGRLGSVLNPLLLSGRGDSPLPKGRPRWHASI